MGDKPSGAVTFLFTDIEGSTRRWEQDPQAMRLALADHDQVFRRAVEPRSAHPQDHPATLSRPSNSATLASPQQPSPP
jgi:hypothetical protein